MWLVIFFFFALVHVLAAAVAPDGSTIPTTVHYIGTGYNLLFGNPDGASWKSGGEDPGLMPTRHIFELEPVGEATEQVIYESHDSCVPSTTEELVFSPKAYQNELLRHVTIGGIHTHEMQALAFTLSSAYTAIKTETETLHYVIEDTSKTCVHGTARYKLSQAGENSFTLTNDFVADVCNLPEANDVPLYWTFIDTWGTHIITGLKLGTRQTNRTIGHLRDYVEKITKTVPSDVSHVGPPEYQEQSYLVNLDLLKLRPDYPIGIDGGKLYRIPPASSSSGTQSIEPIALNLTSIDVALTPDIWRGTQQSDSLGTDVCDVTMRLHNLQQALASYGYRKGASPSQDKNMTMPVQWPRGTYGVPKPKSGCPDGHSRWLEGWLKQNPETQQPDSSWNATHLDGSLTNTIFNLRFCIKTDIEDEFSLDWPAGDYCIFQYDESCPNGFAAGYVQWDGEDDNNANAHGGVLPSGDYGPNTRMNYCCRSDGKTYNPILLPTDMPFYLFQYKHECQEVAGMSVSVEYVNWDDDDKAAPSTASIGSVHPGMHFCNPPDHPGCGTGSTIYYCYYQNNNAYPNAIIG